VNWIIGDSKLSPTEFLKTKRVQNI